MLLLDEVKLLLRDPEQKIWNVTQQTLKQDFMFSECSKCTKCCQLILRKIINIATTRRHILRLKCMKFDFGCGSAPDPAKELTALPQTPWLDLTLVLQVGGNLPPDPVFSPIHQNCLEFFWMLPWLFLHIYIGYRTSKNFFPYLLLSPNFGGKQRAPQVAKN